MRVLIALLLPLLACGDSGSSAGGGDPGGGDAGGQDAGGGGGEEAGGGGSGGAGASGGSSCAPAANPELIYESPGQYLAGVEPFSVATGDLDADGDDDVVVADIAGSVDGANDSIVVFLNDGSGMLMTSARYDTPGLEVALGDMDGDGDLDIVTDFGSVLLNSGSGSFTVDGVYAGGWRGVVLADLDGDGDRDFAATANFDLHVRLNDGAGGLGDPVVTSVGNAALAIAAADLDGDTDLDLVVGMEATGLLDVKPFFNNGAASFTPGAVLPAEIGEHVAAFDADDDGDNDVVSAGWSGDAQLFRNQGNGSFAAPQTLDTGGTQSLAVADVEGDGDLDIALNWTSIRILENDGAGAFASASSARVGVSSEGLALGDLDGDAILDGVVTFPEHGILKVALTATGELRLPREVDLGLNTPVSSAAGDLDGDGDLDLAIGDGSDILAGVDLLRNMGAGRFEEWTHLSTYGEGDHAVEIGDINGDGAEDVAIARYGELHLYYGEDFDHAFADIELSLSSDAQAIELADLDGDGRTDIALTGHSQVTVLLNNGDDTFVRADLPHDSQYMRDVEVVDADGDGDMDLLALAFNPAQLLLFANDGAGAFSAGAATPIEGNPVSLAVLDGDGDGAMDAAISKVFDTGLTFLRNDGTGTFASSRTELGLELGELEPGDIDGDGDADILGTSKDGTVAIVRNGGAGQWEIGLRLPAVEGPATLAIAQLNDDCALDVAIGSATSSTLIVHLAHP